MNNKKIKTYRVVKEVKGTSLMDVLKKERDFEPCELYEIGEDGEELLKTIGFKDN